MPIYKFYCNNCKTNHETYYPWLYRDGMNVIADTDLEECPKCQGPVEKDNASLCTMRPDRFWRGVYDDRLNMYHTSESKFNKYLKQNDLAIIGDRTDREGMTKMAEEGMKAKDRKAEKDVQQGVIDALAWKDEWGDYGTVKERNRKVKERLRLESECPADVHEDAAFK